MNSLQNARNNDELFQQPKTNGKLFLDEISMNNEKYLPMVKPNMGLKKVNTRKQKMYQSHMNIKCHK